MTSETKSPGFFSRLAHPGQFLVWSRYLVWPLAGLSAILFAAGLYLALIASPADYQMGETVRIMYMHVPNAWLSMMCYGVMAVAAFGTLVWRHPLADVAAKSAAPLGAIFTAIALLTGIVWGIPTWGTGWVWDGRLTSMLLHFLIYLGIIAMWFTFEDQHRAGRIIAVFTLVGVVNLVVIHYSVEWWSTLHQPASVFTAEGPKMPMELLTPLFVNLFAFSFLFATLQVISMRTEIMRRRVAAMQRQAAMNRGAAPNPEPAR